MMAAVMHCHYVAHGLDCPAREEFGGAARFILIDGALTAIVGVALILGVRR